MPFQEPPELNKGCTCMTSKMFPHRLLKCSGRLMAPGLLVRNESQFPVLFVLSQLTPLHWDKVDAGAIRHVPCGRVFFTLSTEVYSPETEPTVLGVTLRLASITATTVLLGGVLGVGLVGGLSGVTSSRGTKIDGVLADGKTAVIRGKINDDGAYILTLCLES